MNHVHVGRFACWTLTALLVLVPMFRYADDTFVVLPLFFVFMLAVAGMQAARLPPPPAADYPVPEEWADRAVVWAVFRRSPDGEDVQGIHGVLGTEREAAAYRDELKANAVTNPDVLDERGWVYVAHPYLVGEKCV